MLLTPSDRCKLDSSSDTLFYQQPRFVTHVDDQFIAQLTALYRKLLRPGTKILDLMSSWVSHLPPELECQEIVGHGLNQAELARNPRLNRYFVQNLNENPQLPLGDQEFDAVLNTVSVQYLQQPELIFAEIHRILKPGGIAIISFSNRMFYQKAIQAWRDRSDRQRLELVKSYFQTTPGFSPPQLFVQENSGFWSKLVASDPFYGVVANRSME
ncbi:MAG: methyltransferase domain-containing protein [Pseudanabaenaceae cyanobacterium bins.68]|nr:methyltransferase domain-containing protein [Pseudanabaenaceae cyanobacterium bins.68]